MSNYTTQTAALKATKIDTRVLGAKQIDTKKLFINGELFDPSQVKDNPNEAMFQLLFIPIPEAEEKGCWAIESVKLNQDGEYKQFESSGIFQKGSQTDGVLEDGLYALIEMTENFIKCIDKNITDVDCILNISNASFTKIDYLYNNESEGVKIGRCILENSIRAINGQPIWAIKICEEDDNLSELYGGVTEEIPYLMFLVSIPYYIPENDTSSSTYSLRKTNPFDSLREKFEQMRQQSTEH